MDDHDCGGRRTFEVQQIPAEPRDVLSRRQRDTICIEGVMACARVQSKQKRWAATKNVIMIFPHCKSLAGMYVVKFSFKQDVNKRENTSEMTLLDGRPRQQHRGPFSLELLCTGRSVIRTCSHMPSRCPDSQGLEVFITRIGVHSGTSPENPLSQSNHFS